MRVHALRTGTVWVRERQRSGEGHGLRRFVNTLLDDEWSPPLPILAWLVDHPDGPIVVDAGETSRVHLPGYLPRWHPYYRVGMRAEVQPEEEIGPRLRGVGVDPRDVSTVVLTHLHTDHAGGLHHFARNRILVAAQELRTARGPGGRLRGYLPHRWPSGFDPETVDFVPEPLGPFPRTYPVTSDGTVRLVPTPGHTDGHASVVVEDDDRLVFLAGDTSYTESNLVEGRIDGVAPVGGGEDAAARTLERIRALAAERPLVYLPSHDPESEARLRSGRTVADPGRRTPAPV